MVLERILNDSVFKKTHKLPNQPHQSNSGSSALIDLIDQLQPPGF